MQSSYRQFSQQIVPCDASAVLEWDLDSLFMVSDRPLLAVATLVGSDFGERLTLTDPLGARPRMTLKGSVVDHSSSLKIEQNQKVEHSQHAVLASTKASACLIRLLRYFAICQNQPNNETTCVAGIAVANRASSLMA